MDKLDLDCTPALPLPPARLIEAVQTDLPSLLSDFRGGIPADYVAALLVKRGHCRAAAEWAIFEEIRAGRLIVGRVSVELPQVACRGGGWSGGGGGFVPIPNGRAAPFSAFTVAQTEALWRYWRDGDAAAAPLPPKRPKNRGGRPPLAETKPALVSLYLRVLAVVAECDNDRSAALSRLKDDAVALDLAREAGEEKLSKALLNRAIDWDRRRPGA